LAYFQTYLVIETGLLDLGDENVVGLTGDLDTLLGDVSENANGNSGTREGVAVHE
jgi:hypothetical protein